MYEKISEETSRIIVGNLPPKRWPDLAKGLWEASIEAAFEGYPGGVRFDEQHYDQIICRKNLLEDDIKDIIQDGAAHIYRQVIDLTPKSVLDYKCGYKLMPNMNILVAIDERDFLIPSELSPLEEFCFGTQD